MAPVPKRREVGPVFRRVLNCFESYSSFAEVLGESRQVVNYWLRIRYIPPEWAVEVSVATGGRVKALEILSEARRARAAKRAGWEKRGPKPGFKRGARVVGVGVDGGRPDGEA